jgi:hypothetical protein
MKTSTHPSAEPYSRPACLACGKQPGRRAYVLSRLVTTMQRTWHAYGGHLEHGWVSDVQDDEGLQEFCGEKCWTVAESDVREAWRLVQTFNGYVPETDCARCEKKIDRLLQHVVLSLGDEEFIDDHVRTHVGWDYAVLCLDCGAGSMSESAKADDPADTLVNTSTAKG